jgi:hypothetical protein
MYNGRVLGVTGGRNIGRPGRHVMRECRGVSEALLFLSLLVMYTVISVG